MDRFLNTVRRDVPGCPNPLIKDEVLSAAIEFCERTSIYTEKLTESVLAGAETLTITLPANTALIGIDRLEINDTDYFDIDHDGTTIDFGEAVPSALTIYVYVSLKPLRTVTTLPDVLFNDWFQAIAAGAKAKLMIMPEKKWTNPNLAMVHADVFENKVGSAIQEATRKTMPQEKKTARNGWL